MRTAAFLVMALLAAGHSPAFAWTANDATLVRIAREVVNPPDGSTFEQLYPPSGPKSQGHQNASAQCNLYNTCSASLVNNLERTYTKASGDPNLTLTVTALLYALVSVGGPGANSALGRAGYEQSPGSGWDRVTRQTNGSDGKTVEFDKVLQETTTVQIPMESQGEASRTPPAGYAYGYGNTTVTLPNPP